MMQKKTIKPEEQRKIERLISEFQMQFEACSLAHAKGDGYKFGFLFSQALNAAVRLIYLCEGGESPDEIPPNFLSRYSYPLDLEIEELGTQDLKQANRHKRKLLDLFIRYLPVARETFNIKTDTDEISTLLETIYKRDLIWNFRDISTFNKKIKKGLIFRSSALCLNEDKEQLIKLFESYGIKTIIDLRAYREYATCQYKQDFFDIFDIIDAPFDTWQQSSDFKNTYKSGSHAEIAYHFFSLECKPSIKKVAEAIINSEGASVVHCHAGKDRTGVIATIFHLLSGAGEDEIFSDYLASGQDTEIAYLQIFLDSVKITGGIENYLKSCELTNTQTDKLRIKLCK